MYHMHQRRNNHCVKSVYVASFPGSYFPAFVLNTYAGKNGPENSEYGHFSRIARPCQTSMIVLYFENSLRPKGNLL